MFPKIPRGDTNILCPVSPLISPPRLVDKITTALIVTGTQGSNSFRMLLNDILLTDDQYIDLLEDSKRIPVTLKKIIV